MRPKLNRCDICRNDAHVLFLNLLLLKFNAVRIIAPLVSLSCQLAHTTSYWLLELTLRQWLLLAEVGSFDLTIICVVQEGRLWSSVLWYVRAATLSQLLKLTRHRLRPLDTLLLNVESVRMLVMHSLVLRSDTVGICCLCNCGHVAWFSLFMCNKDVYISSTTLTLSIRVLYSIGIALVLFNWLALKFLLWFRRMIICLEVLYDVGICGMLLTGKPVCLIKHTHWLSVLMRWDHATWLLIQLLLGPLNRGGTSWDLSMAMWVLLLSSLCRFLTDSTHQSLTSITLMYRPISWNLSLTIIWCYINKLLFHLSANYIRATLSEIIILALRL